MQNTHFGNTLWNGTTPNRFDFIIDANQGGIFSDLGLGPRGTQGGGTILGSKKFSAPESMSSPILLYHYLQNLVTSFCFLLSIFKSMPFLGWGRCFSTVLPTPSQAALTPTPCRHIYTTLIKPAPNVLCMPRAPFSHFTLFL